MRNDAIEMRNDAIEMRNDAIEMRNDDAITGLLTMYIASVHDLLTW